MRNEWLGCQLVVEKSLAPLTDFEYMTIENTRNCYLTDGTSPEFLSDPCCNGLLQLNQCCAPRNVSVKVPVRSVDSNAMAATCLSPRCSQEIVKDYAALERSALISDGACLEDTRASLTDTAFLSNPVLTCFNQVIKFSCIDKYGN